MLGGAGELEILFEQHFIIIVTPRLKTRSTGYAHGDTANTFQDTVNDKFGRVGQIAFDNSGAMGDLIGQYDFNGMGP